jgi:hypothetical protein
MKEEAENAPPRVKSKVPKFNFKNFKMKQKARREVWNEIENEKI